MLPCSDLLRTSDVVKNDQSLSFCAYGREYVTHKNMLLTNLSKQIDTRKHTHASMHVCGKLKNMRQLGIFFGIVNKVEASNEFLTYICLTDVIISLSDWIS